MDKDISDMMKKFSDMMGNSSFNNNSNESSANFSGIDMNTILKLKTAMDNVNKREWSQK